MYVTHSRLLSGDPRHSHLDVAHLLPQHGADPNGGYLWEGAYLFTALTGAFGYGEDSPPAPAPQSIALATLLLDAGADPNGDQTIYNRHFRPDNDYLYYAHPRTGPAPPRPLAQRLSGDLAEPKHLLEDVLVFAADSDDRAERVGLVLRHGVDPDGRGTQHPGAAGHAPNRASARLRSETQLRPPSRRELSRGKQPDRPTGWTLHARQSHRGPA